MSNNVGVYSLSFVRLQVNRVLIVVLYWKLVICDLCKCFNCIMHELTSALIKNLYIHVGDDTQVMANHMLNI